MVAAPQDDVRPLAPHWQMLVGTPSSPPPVIREYERALAAHPETLSKVANYLAWVVGNNPSISAPVKGQFEDWALHSSSALRAFATLEGKPVAKNDPEAEEDPAARREYAMAVISGHKLPPTIPK